MGKQIKSRTLAYLVHLVDSGQTRNGALGLECGRRMRGEESVRRCPKGCEFCWDAVEARV